ncbi:MAG: cell division protein FtsX [Noviherbaspirillum sp.]
MKAWLRQHRFALAQACASLTGRFGGFAFNVLVVAIALALPFAGLTLLENMRPVSGKMAVEPEISIFMGMETPRARAEALATEIRRVVREQQGAARLEFIPREQALSALKQRSNLSGALATLGGNPLPDAYVLRLEGLHDTEQAGRIERIAVSLKALPGVETVQVDSAWVKRLAALLNVLWVALLLLAATLGIVVVAVVFNTVRLQVVTQREEIEVSRLVGATDAYIYRPFYYSGALLGLCAGVIALAVVALGLQPLNTAIAGFARLYASEFSLVPLSLLPSIVLLGLSAALGWCGAVLSVRRHLNRLNPS